MADPFAGQGSVSFKKPSRTYGDIYTDTRSRAQNVAKSYANAGYNVGSDGRGDWTVKGKRAAKKTTPRGRKRA